MSHPHRRPTDPNAEALDEVVNAEAAAELAALGREPIPAAERERVNELVRKAIQSGVYRVQRPANDTGRER